MQSMDTKHDQTHFTWIDHAKNRILTPICKKLTSLLFNGKLEVESCLEGTLSNLIWLVGLVGFGGCSCFAMFPVL
jgi:hypothetical protein